jgi:hypothetical protein
VDGEMACAIKGRAAGNVTLYQGLFSLKKKKAQKTLELMA